MAKQTISVCMITKDEERNIERCIGSIRHIADEILVVDTGSTDRTVELAEKMGAQVIHRPWDNDFSAARNASLEKAKMDWILFLDADEEISKEDGLALQEILQKEKRFEGFYLRLVNIIKGVDIGDAIVLRVFKNKPEYRFRGRMHEQVINAIQDVAGPDCIGSTGIRILHYGYDPDVSDPKEKQKRNIELLHSYPEEERDGYFYYSIGNEYARINDSEKAMEMYHSALDNTNLSAFRPIYYPYLILNMAKVLFSNRRFAEEIKVIEECLKNCMDYKDIYFMQCLAYSEMSKFSKAKQSLLNYMNCVPQHYEYPSNNFDQNYNIEELLNHLSQAAVDHEEKLLSVLMLVEDCDESIVDTIKSVNEIAYEVVVVAPKKINFDMKIAQNFGATVVEVAKFERDKCLVSGIKNCVGKYILLLDAKNICSVDTQKELIRALHVSKAEALSMPTLNLATGLVSHEVRVIKNSKKLKKIADFEQLCSSPNVQELPIYLHQIQ